jgi:hypothetical protein
LSATVLVAVEAVDPRERVDPGLGRRIPNLLGAVSERRVVARDPREPRELAVERVRRVEVVVHRRRVGADVVVVAGPVVAGNRVAQVVVLEVLRREHVLTRVLVPAGSGEALLVAVVDDRVAPREVHESVRQLVTLEKLGLARARVRVAHEHADPPAVVVAQEGRQVVDVRVAVRVPVVVDKEVAQLVRRRRPGGEARGGGLEREVQDALHLVVRHVVRGDRPAEVFGDLAEHVEVADPLRSRVALDLWCEPEPERVVDVLHGVHPEAVDAEVADPGHVDVDHSVDDTRVLGEEVVEPEEVAVLRVLPAEGRVAAVVVEAHVVEPGGDLRVALSVRDARVIREAAEPGRRSRARRLAGG